MKNEQVNKQETSAIDQLVIILNNSKYTYEQFTQFHETVLSILDNNDLSHLNKEQMKSALFFIDIIVSLLDAPKRSMVMQRRQTSIKSELIKEQNIQDNYTGIPAKTKDDNRKIQHLASRESLHELIEWISQIVLRKHITIETMLDEFYSLNFVRAKNC